MFNLKINEFEYWLDKGLNTLGIISVLSVMMVSIVLLNLLMLHSMSLRLWLISSLKLMIPITVEL